MMMMMMMMVMTTSVVVVVVVVVTDAGMSGSRRLSVCYQHALMYKL